MVRNAFLIGIIILLLMCPCSFAANQDASGAAVSASEILDKVGTIMDLTDIRSEQVMTVAREDATIRQYRLKIMTSGKDKAFAVIIEPEKLKGRQFLRLGDTVWAYFPAVSSFGRGQAESRAKRSIRVSGKETFMGGDFTNFDLLRVNLIDNYIPKIVEDLPDQYILELKGKNLNLTYPIVRLWVRKGDYQPIRAEYNSLSDDLIKSVFYQDYRDFGEGFIRPGMLEMKSAVLPKAKTFLEIIYLTKNAKNPANRFLKANLGR